MNKDLEIISAAEKGLFLLDQIQSTNQLQLIKLDTALQHQWSGLLPIEKDFRLAAKRVANDNLYLLAQYKDFSKFDFQIYRIDQETSRYTRDPIRSFIPFQPTEFQVSAQAALIGGYFNRVPVVIYFSFLTQKSKVLAGLFNDVGELTQIKMHEDGSFDVLISAMNWSKQRTLWIKNYTAEGELVRNLALDTREKQHLIFGRSIESDNNMQVIAGVYGTRSAEYARGIFIATLDPSGMQQTRYYNFADLKNFFKYLKAGREQRIKNRIERKKIKGKKIKFNYRFLVHEIIPYNGQFILLGEAFYPRYTTVNPSYGTFFSSPARPGPYLNNGRIFEGYYYTHAVVMGFDENGNLLWDNSFEINDINTFTLDQFVKLEAHDDKIALIYLFENEIRTKIIQNNNVVEGKSSNPIDTFNRNEIVKKEKNNPGKLEYWYNNYLIAYGVQDLHSSDAKGRKTRRVFYINKVTVGE